MGLEMSKEEQRRHMESVEREMKCFTNCPDVKVNRTIVMFCSAASSDNLQQHLDQRKQKRYPIADWMKKLAEKVANLCPDPKLAGLGALAVAVFIDIISATPSSSETMKDALRCVFAEEKASEVWVLIEECLKKCLMYIDDDDELVSEIKQIERQLSTAITKLKKSMTRDDHMSSQALKAWVNGAAFHIQMLIHLVRLGGTRTCHPIEVALSLYQSDLELLFEKHKAAVKKKCTLGNCFSFEPPAPIFFQSEEGEWHFVRPFIPLNDFFEGYYKVHYISQKREITKYFREVGDGLSELVGQVGCLSICYDEE